MELSKCVRCGKLYNRVRITVCLTCQAEEEKDILEVSRYLKDNPNSTLDEVSDALSIYLEDISRWIEEKRLEVQIHYRAALKCTSCGSPVPSGRFCKECEKKLFEDPLEKLRVTWGGVSVSKLPAISRSRGESGSIVGKYRGS